MTSKALVAGVILLLGTGASGATPISLDDFLTSFRKKGIAVKLAQATHDQTSSRALASKSALGSWSTTFESEIGTRPDDERKVSAGLSRTMTFGVDEQEIERRFSKEGEADLLANQAEVREQELQIAKLYIKLRLQKALRDTANKTRDDLNPIVTSIQNAAKRGSIGYLASMRATLLLSEVSADLDAAQSNYRSLAKLANDAIGISVPDEPASADFVPVEGQLSNKDLELGDYPAYKEILLRQDALASEAAIVSSQREVGASIGVTRETRSSSTAVTLGIDIPILTGSVVSSRTRELHSSRSVLSAKADLIAAKVSQQYHLLKAEITAAQDRIRRLDGRLEEIGRLAESAASGFRRGQAEAEAVTEAIAKRYEVSVAKGEAIAEYENLIAEMRTLTGELSHAK